MTQNQNTQVSESVTPISTTSYVGQVKWFNNRLGYGFITIVSECERRNEDIFVHQQHITPQTSDYRSLQQGEYVSFQLGKADSETESAKHVTQAVNVTGVFGGTLMCDQIPRRNGPSTPSTTREEGTRKTTKPVAQSTETPAQTQPQSGARRGAPRGGRGGARGNTRGGRQTTTAAVTESK